MQPFAQAGLVNMSKLAEYVLTTGFGVKNAAQFLQAPPPPPEEMAPQGMPPGMEGMPPEGMMPQELPPQGPAGLESLPPEILQLLLAQGQQQPPM
jgi:hypothetical protein